MTEGVPDHSMEATRRPGVTHLSHPADRRAELIADVTAGLLKEPRTMPSKYFYDDRGSQLFDDITRLPEYYLSRDEITILEYEADAIIQATEPHEIIEIGSGYSVKAKLMLDAMRRAGCGTTYVPIDISEAALVRAAEHLTVYYPWLTIDGYVGDFFTDLARVPHRGTRLVTFFGSTIGNFDEPTRGRVLASMAGMLQPGDALLLGVDLVKEPETLLAAYDDAPGVTAEFNRNMLHVLNRELDANFPVEEFNYIVTWNAERMCVEMGLEAPREMTVRLGALSADISLAPGELIRNEVSCKFTKEVLCQDLGEAGLHIAQWHLGPHDRYALALALPSPSH